MKTSSNTSSDLIDQFFYFYWRSREPLGPKNIITSTVLVKYNNTLWKWPELAFCDVRSMRGTNYRLHVPLILTVYTLDSNGESLPPHYFYPFPSHLIEMVWHNRPYIKPVKQLLKPSDSVKMFRQRCIPSKQRPSAPRRRGPVTPWLILSL